MSPPPAFQSFPSLRPHTVLSDTPTPTHIRTRCACRPDVSSSFMLLEEVTKVVSRLSRQPVSSDVLACPLQPCFDLVTIQTSTHKPLVMLGKHRPQLSIASSACSFPWHAQLARVMGSHTHISQHCSRKTSSRQMYRLRTERACVCACVCMCRCHLVSVSLSLSACLSVSLSVSVSVSVYRVLPLPKTNKPTKKSTCWSYDFIFYFSF